MLRLGLVGWGPTRLGHAQTTAYMCMRFLSEFISAFFTEFSHNTQQPLFRHGFCQATHIFYCNICCHTCYRSRWAEFFLLMMITKLYFGVRRWSGQNAVPRRGTVRLVRHRMHLPSYSSGRVQIYFTNWGHICDDVDFASNEADVICHQQGYTGAASYSRASADLSVWADIRCRLLASLHYSLWRCNKYQWRIPK